jgi:head-tail adaptor
MSFDRVRIGQRDRLITVQAATPTTDDYGGETMTYADVEQAYARVTFGTAAEKREAAQVNAIQTATFEVLPTQALLDTPMMSRIVFDGSNWNITEKAEVDRNTLRFTATRAA